MPVGGRGAVVVTAALLVALLGSAAAAAATLKPDLIARPLDTIRLCQEDPGVLFRADACTGTGRTVLRMTSDVANRGAGPLEFAPDESAEPNDCNNNGDPTDDVLVNQRLYVDGNGDGVFERDQDTAFHNRLAGCRYYHPEHMHYHLEGYSHFLLKSERTGKTVASGDKISFCIIDSGAFRPGLPGAPADPYYMLSDCASKDGITGTSVGWYDEYIWKLYGQTIDVTALPAGKYCLIEQVDPKNHFVESNNGNNSAEAKIHLNPAKAPANSARTIKPLGTHC